MPEPRELLPTPGSRPLREPGGYVTLEVHNGSCPSPADLEITVMCSLPAATIEVLPMAFVDRGEFLLAGVALIWPVGALVTYAIRRPAREDAWQPFAAWMVAAVVIGVALALISIAMVMSNGTTRSMASLGPTVGAGLMFAGALVCGLVAGVLKLTGPRS